MAKNDDMELNSFELDLFAEQFWQLEIEETETYNLSVAEILEGASRSATGSFEIEMREYFEVKAENAFSIMDETVYPNLNLLRRYLLFGAKIAIIEFLMRPEIQAEVREFYQKRLHVERYCFRQTSKTPRKSKRVRRPRLTMPPARLPRPKGPLLRRIVYPKTSHRE